MKTAMLLVPVVFATACTGSTTPPGELPADPADEGCPAIFRQGIVPEYHVEISDAEWNALVDEFLNREERIAQGLDPNPYHPVTMRYVAGDQELTADAPVLLRLKGNSSWMWALELDEDPKMQFVLAFNEVEKDGRFQGVRKVELDMPRFDQTFLHQRIALAYMREAGLPAQCANNARLYVNGEYYGLYTHLERLDKEFLQRVYGDQDEGDLWKGGYEISTNEDSYDPARNDALWAAQTLDEIDALTDLEASMYEWAAEAMIGDADGYYNGRANYFLYDHPQRGFIWLPHDVDTAIDPDFMVEATTPVFPSCVLRWPSDWHHYVVALNDPRGLEMYAEALAAARARYDVAAMQERIDVYADQIAQAAADDPHRPFTMDSHYLQVTRSWDYLAGRAEYIDAWLACWNDGVGEDADGDGHDMCHDCNDFDGTIHPGAAEICNEIDDDCDGVLDDAADGGSVCP